MKYPHKHSKKVTINDDITLHEYCHPNQNLPIDGALAKINGPFGPKINKTFSELFFVISGTLELEIDGVLHQLSAKDMFIVAPGVKHRINGKDSEVFISCSPQFNVAEVEFCD